MKKTVCIFLAIISLIALAGLAACNKPVGKLPLICRVINPVEGIDAKEEFTKWNSEPAAVEGRAQTLTVTVNGESLTGNYSNSAYVNWCPEMKHNYMTENLVSFSVNDEGTVIYYNNPYPGTGEAITKDAATEIAKAFIKTIYPDADLDKYSLSANVNKDDNSFSIAFIKYAGEIISFDHVEVNVDSTGTVREYSSFIFGKISDDLASAFDADKMKKKITAKCDSISKAAKKQYDSLVYDDYSYILTLDEEGNAAMVVLTEIRCQKEHEEIVSASAETVVLYFPNDTLK